MTTIQEQASQQSPTQPTDDRQPGGVPPVLSILAAAMTATMLDLGDRTGLNRALAAGPADPAELAERTGGNERLIAEWLRCLDAAGLLTSAGRRSQWLPEVAGMLAGPRGAPGDLSAGIGLFSVLASCVPLVAAAFDSGAVAAEQYPDGLAASMQSMSEGWTASALPELWVPAIEGLAGRLTAGGRVAELGCGAGHALQALGRRYPGLTGEGFELDARQVEQGNQRLVAAGLADRVRLQAVDAVAGLRGPYDLVLALSVLHDIGDLDSTLRVIADCLAPQGHLLVVESPPLRGPLAAMLLATSTLYCVPSVQARGQQALGTLGLPPEVLIPAAARAGLVLDPPLPPATPLVLAYSFAPSR
jgi:SAM-dependent methyltransferase